MTRPLDDQDRELERYGHYLHLLARLHLDTALAGKVDVSGVVQQTLLEAYQARDRFQGQGEEPRAAWLRQILANNLRDEVRKLGTAARNVGREVSLEASSARLEAWLAAEQSSPSQRLVRAEEHLALAEALAGLPDDQRRAIELHHLTGKTLAETAAELDRSRGAVAQLLFRGLHKLRQTLDSREPE
jgi:RNA polymerase sigma-70 factor (ECF subfamily)